MIELIKQFGFPVATSVALVATFIWISKLLITHFISQMKEATEERKTMTERFATTVDNHINHNTEILTEVMLQMKESRSEHGEMKNHLEWIRNHG